MLKKYYDLKSSEVHLIPVSDQDSFEDAWNQIGIDDNGNEVNVDAVVINTHANPYVIGFGKAETDSYSSIDITTANFQDKTMKALILYGCNAGHLDYSEDNVASQFARLVNGAPVLASDGSVSMRGPFGSYKSKNSDSFKDWGTSKRKNDGWIKYQLDEDGNVNTTTLDIKKMTLKSMLKKLK